MCIVRKLKRQQNTMEIILFWKYTLFLLFFFYIGAAEHQENVEQEKEANNKNASCT